MLTRRINLILGLSIVAILAAGLALFAVTTNEPAAPTSGAGGHADETVGADTGNADVTNDAQPDNSGTATTDAQVGTGEPTPAIGGLDGSALYADHCASCHGSRGNGGSGGPVDDLAIDRAEVIEITTDGVPRMPAYRDALTADEIAAVADYVLELNE